MLNKITIYINMKKTLTILFIFCAFALNSCSDMNHPIVGHSYGYSEGSELISFYFSAKRNTCLVQVNSSISGAFSSSHFIYKIDGTSVDIYYDRSAEWKEEARGVLAYHLSYNSTNNTLSYLGIILYQID